MARSYFSSTSFPRGARPRPEAAASPSSSMARRFSRVTRVAPNGKSAVGSLRTIGWRRLSRFPSNSFTTPAFRPTSGCSPIGNRRSGKKKSNSLDARNFWVQMEKSLGNKRRRIGDPDEKEKDPDHIAEITKIFGNFRDGETRAFKIDGQEKTLVVSKVFDNDDFGFHKI